jgi:hypothetical protein
VTARSIKRIKLVAKHEDTKMKKEKEKRSKIAGGDLVVDSLDPVTGTLFVRSREGSEPCRDSKY